jgi:hypothetical protein
MVTPKELQCIARRSVHLSTLGPQQGLSEFGDVQNEKDEQLWRRSFGNAYGQMGRRMASVNSKHGHH